MAQIGYYEHVGDEQANEVTKATEKMRKVRWSKL